MIEQARRFRAVGHGAELVHRGSALDAPVGRGGRVHPIQRVRVAADLFRCQRTADDEEPVAVKLLALPGRDWPRALDAVWHLVSFSSVGPVAA
jgi:hypothetical protein